MTGSPAFRLYLALSGPVKRFADRTLEKRLSSGKEDPDRIGERKGVPGLSRPEGRLIWFHAASVGESVSLLTLIEALLEEDPDLNILVTTVTRTSARLMRERLPEGAIHQFAPVDVRSYIRSFLDHWRPDIAVWTESELWPALIFETRQSVKSLFLLNARMSRRSFKKWRWMRGTVRSMLRLFDMILVQDRQSAEFLSKLGAIRTQTKVVGSLKESSEALPHNEAERTEIANELRGRPVWLAASTHPGEEIAAADAHQVARRASPQLLLIIAPRHPERGPEIAATLRERGWRVGLRSDDDVITPNMDIYVADTLGEMGLWYRVAPISFVGGSLAKIGGHNPFEPAALGSAIIHGPHVESAMEVYARLQDGEGAIEVTDAQSLGDAVIRLLEPHVAAQYAHAA